MVQGWGEYRMKSVLLKTQIGTQARYRDDRLTPFISYDGTPPSLPCCSNPDFAPTTQQVESYFHRIGGEEKK